MGYNLLPVSTSLWKYTCVVLARAFGEFTWGRDTAIGCGLSVATIALQVHWGLISVTDWKQHTEQWIGSVVLPFVAVLVIHIAWRLVTAPWRLHQDQEQKHADEVFLLSRKLETCKTELQNETDKIQQPDVALVWDWTDEVKAHNQLFGRTEKDIIVHNRSNEYVYRVQIDPVRLMSALEFDLIPCIAPSEKHIAVGRWMSAAHREMTSSSRTDYGYYFASNEQAARETGWYVRKPHDRGIGDGWFKIPMTVRYRCRNTEWITEFEFIYDMGSESFFTRGKGKRL